MDKKEAISFLKQHQPMPSQTEVTQEVIDTFDEVRKYFIANPDPDCIPLFLNAFADDMGLGLYQICDDVFRRYDQSTLTPHIADALCSRHKGVRWWAAHWAMEFTSPELLLPLQKLSTSKEDSDAHYFALAAIGFIYKETGSKSALEFLRRRLQTEKDPETKEMLLESVQQQENC